MGESKMEKIVPKNNDNNVSTICICEKLQGIVSSIFFSQTLKLNIRSVKRN